jgi:hypothetical protein
MPIVNHIHTFIRYKAKQGYYRCNSPDCTYSVPKGDILGKLSRCTQCGEQIILTKEDLRRASPRCLECSNTKKAIAHRKARTALNMLGTFKTEPPPSFLLPPPVFQPDDEEEREELLEEEGF